MDAYSPLAWIAFNAFVLLMLALDLGVFRRKSHVVSLKESIVWTAVWIGLAMVFNLGLAAFSGKEKALQFFAGYIIEKSLSIDNVFVFVILFNSFRVPAIHQHKVLFWGILGALIMRAIMIALGVTLLERFTWLTYVFGAILILTGLKLLARRESSSTSATAPLPPLVSWLRQRLPVTETFREGRFFVREQGRRMVTPLFFVLLLVEGSDLIFAVDSIPAVFAVSRDPFIIYTSNVFAILGLRSLYFALSGFMDRFRHLKTGLGFILAFVGVKMVLAHSAWKIETHHSLVVILLALTISILLSLLPRRSSPPRSPAPLEQSKKTREESPCTPHLT